MGADDVGGDKNTGAEDRPVDVRFGGKVDDGIDVLEGNVDGVGVGDVA